MRTLLSTSLLAILALALLSGADDAAAEARRIQPYPLAVLPPTEGRGCYYDRGREYCGSYCYWEINGKRYCQPRLRDAHSQAAPEHFYIAEPRPYARGGATFK